MSDHQDPRAPHGDFEAHLAEGLDRIAASTRTTPPERFHPHDLPLTALTRPDSRPRFSYLIAAAAAVAVIIGLVAVQQHSNSSSPSATQPTAGASTTQAAVATSTTDVAPTTVTGTINTSLASPTTSQDHPGDSPVILVGSVICVDAGAGQEAVAACTEELGGSPLTAAATSADSFVMPAHPTATDSAASETVARILGLDVRDYNPGILPPGSNPSTQVTTYLLLGTSNPYGSNR